MDCDHDWNLYIGYASVSRIQLHSPASLLLLICSLLLYPPLICCCQGKASQAVHIMFHFNECVALGTSCALARGPWHRKGWVKVFAVCLWRMHLRHAFHAPQLGTYLTSCRGGQILGMHKTARAGACQIITFVWVWLHVLDPVICCRTNIRNVFCGIYEMQWRDP